MASEDGAGIVSNVGCDVNNTNQRADEPAGGETTRSTLAETTWRNVVEKTTAAIAVAAAAGRACDPAHSSSRTPTGFPTASPFHANTEGHGRLQRDSDPASLSGDVGEQVASEPDNESRSPSPQRRSMSHQRTDPDSGTARFPGEPDGNLVLCLSSLREVFGEIFSRGQQPRSYPRCL